MYRFQINALTQIGESIGLVGSIPELGQWDLSRCVRLQTLADRYPLWWADVDIVSQPTAATAESTMLESIEYKYVRLDRQGKPIWEPQPFNRQVPFEARHQGNRLIVEDHWFGDGNPWPYGYFEKPIASPALPLGEQGLKIVVLGSSVALGCNAWLLQGWADSLAQTLHQRYGHQLVNCSEIGANVSRAIDRFPLVVTPEKPDIVIVALSLGNEGLAYCAPHERRAVQRRFESGLQQLVKMIREIGAYPILGGVYPHGDYNAEHHWLLQDTHQRMLGWGVPVIDWLKVLDDGQGHWRAGTAFNATHPNTVGHHLMYTAIDQSLFQMDAQQVAHATQLPPRHEIPLYRDDQGFHIFYCPEEQQVRLINTSPYSYEITPTWRLLQSILQERATLAAGLYLAQAGSPGVPASFWVQPEGTIQTTLVIPPDMDQVYRSASYLFSPSAAEILFYDGQLGLLKSDPLTLWVLNESDHEYNLHPMWKEVRQVLKAMPGGVYEDAHFPDIPFRTLMIGPDGLESRVKIPPRSAVLFHYRSPLSAVQRVAILPLGDRCAARMMLYKMEFDGPAFPFDLTRTTNLADVADMIATGFDRMWNPDLLHYNPIEKRIYHSHWTGLSFAHEVEDSDDPLRDMSPVHERMRVRYSARAARFWYTLQRCDRVLFVRTGGTDRGKMIDLLAKLDQKCEGKPYQLLLFSLQDSDEFAELPQVLHYNIEFNPDHMYADHGHWQYCTNVFHQILTELGISSKNLFWCPPNPPKL